MSISEQRRMALIRSADLLRLRTKLNSLGIMEGGTAIYCEPTLGTDHAVEVGRITLGGIEVRLMGTKRPFTMVRIMHLLPGKAVNP